MSGATDAEVNLDLLLPSQLPEGTRVFLDEQEISAPWGKKTLKTGKRSLIFQHDCFQKQQLTLMIDATKAHRLMNPPSWEPILSVVTQRVQGILSQPVEEPDPARRIQRRIDQLEQAKAFALSVYQFKGDPTIPAGIQDILSGREAFLNATVLWREGLGGVQDLKKALELDGVRAPGVNRAASCGARSETGTGAGRSPALRSGPIC